MLLFKCFTLLAGLLYLLQLTYVIVFSMACRWTEKWFELACFGDVLLFCLCEDRLSVFWNTSSDFSFACCKWWNDAGIMALEKFMGRCEGTGAEFFLLCFFINHDTKKFNFLARLDKDRQLCTSDMQTILDKT